MTGNPLTDAEATDPGYWAGQVRRPVRFSDAVLTLHREPARVYLEVGPGKTLSGAVLQHPNGQSDDARVAAIDSLGHPSKKLPALESVLAGLGKLWQAGVPVEWAAVYSNASRRRVPLPTYPFERQRHWVDPPPLVAQAPSARPGPANLTEAATNAPAAPASKAADVPPADSVGDDDPIAVWLATTIADHSGLDAAAIDRTGNFTDLGFDSLILTQVNSQIRRQYRIRVPLEQLLTESSTIETLGAYINGEVEKARSADRETVEPVGNGAGVNAAQASVS